MAVHVARIASTDRDIHGLGRHVEHDEQSRGFEWRGGVGPLPTEAVSWPINEPILNQWNYQACVGNAFAQFLNTDFSRALRTKLNKGWFTEGDALSIYSLATHDDGLHQAGQFFPPNDDGSSGLGGAKACQSMGYLKAYLHTFSFESFLRALSTQPVVMGTAWTNTMENADPETGLVSVGSLDDSNIAGGHEYLAAELIPVKKLIGFYQSWGASWGLGGKFYISYDEYEALLALQGDVIVPQLAL